MLSSSTNDTYQKLSVSDNIEMYEEKIKKVLEDGIKQNITSHKRHFSECKFYYHQNHVHKELTIEKSKWQSLTKEYFDQQIKKVEQELPNPQPDVDITSLLEQEQRMKSQLTYKQNNDRITKHQGDVAGVMQNMKLYFQNIFPKNCPCVQSFQNKNKFTNLILQKKDINFLSFENQQYMLTKGLSKDNILILNICKMRCDAGNPQVKFDIIFEAPLQQEAPLILTDPKNQLYKKIDEYIYYFKVSAKHIYGNFEKMYQQSQIFEPSRNLTISSHNSNYYSQSMHSVQMENQSCYEIILCRFSLKTHIEEVEFKYLWSNSYVPLSVTFAEDLNDPSKQLTQKEFIENQIVVVFNHQEVTKENSTKLQQIYIDTRMISDFSIQIDQSVSAMFNNQISQGTGIIYMYQKKLDDGNYIIGRMNNLNTQLKKIFLIEDRARRKNYFADAETQQIFDNHLQKNKISQKLYDCRHKQIQQVEQNYKIEKNQLALLPLHAGFKNTFNENDTTIMIHFHECNMNLIVHAAESFDQNYIRTAQSFGLDKKLDDNAKFQKLLKSQEQVSIFTYMIYPYISNIGGVGFSGHIAYRHPSNKWNELKPQQDIQSILNLQNDPSEVYQKLGRDIGIGKNTTNKHLLYHDDRTVVARINYSQQTNKLYVELFDCVDDLVIQSLPVEFGNQFEGKEKNIRICESSVIQMVSKEKKIFKQNYQLLIISESMNWCRIFTFKVEWSEIIRKNSHIELFEMKILLLAEPLSKYAHIIFFPLYENDENFLIIGTQIISALDKITIQLENFHSYDYKIKNDISSQGYRLYTKIEEFDHVQKILLVESRLSSNILENGGENLIQRERITLLEMQLRTTLNMVPLDTKHILTHDSSEIGLYDLLQPLEALDGNCYFDYVQKSQQALNLLKKAEEQIEHGFDIKKKIQRKSLLEKFTFDKPELYADLKEKSWVRNYYEVVVDLFGDSIIWRLHQNEKENVIIMKNMLRLTMKLQKTRALSVLLQSMIQQLVGSQIHYNELRNFFIDFPEENSKMEINYQLKWAESLYHENLQNLYHKEIDFQEFSSHEIPDDEIVELIQKHQLAEQQDCCQAQTIPIRSFFLNNRKVGTAVKIRNYNYELQVRQFQDYQTCEFQISNTIAMINDQFPQDINKQISLKAIIDYQFENSKEYFIKDLVKQVSVIYIPFMIQIYSTSPNVIIACNIAILISSIENMICRYNSDKAINTYTDFNPHTDWFGMNDYLMTILVLVYFPMRMGYLKDPLPKNFSEGNTDEFLWFSIIVCLNYMITICLVFKSFFYFKMVASLNIFATLIIQCLNDIKAFAIFLIFTIWIFSFLRHLIGVDVDGADYPEMSFEFQQFVQTYRNSIGDIAAPDYAFWTKHCVTHPIIAYFGVGSIWINWFINQFLVLIILLNFLIAIISQSYDKVMGQIEEYQYLWKSHVNRLVIIRRMKRGNIDCYWTPIITARVEMEEKDQEYTGIVDTIKRVIKNETLKLKMILLNSKSTEGNFQNQFKDISQKQDDIKTQVIELKQDFKTEVIELKQEFESKLSLVAENQESLEMNFQIMKQQNERIFDALTIMIQNQGENKTVEKVSTPKFKR